MRHRKTGRKFGKNSSHRQAMFRNMVSSLIEHGRIRTTTAKAKELRRFVDKTITWGTSLGSLITTPKDKLSDDQKAKIVHHYRMAKRLLPDKNLLTKLFQEIAPLYLDETGTVRREGGYTRVVKGLNRRGDNAPMAIIELMDYNFTTTEAPVEETNE
ncbi:50S ribosomal protein L17 [Myxococcota bacterium]|nr:50S ribosomal protein L17 [Myxococcota bacterium]